MNFVKHHLNRHHFFHKPHKWFLALLISPIHFAELVYKKHYHLRFKNARKLFIFDATLLLSIIIISSVTIFWYTYDPTVKNFVELSVKSSADRKRSGDVISFNVNYKNLSHTQLKEVVIALNFPEHFSLLTAEPNGNYVTSSASFHLPDLMPKESGSVSISGRLFQTPGKSVHISTYLSYRQAHKTDREEKASAYISEPQSSVLTAELNMDSVALAAGRNKFTLILKNDGNTTLSAVVPFAKNKDGVFQNNKVTIGSANSTEWLIDTLAPSATAECDGEFVTQIPDSTNETSISFTPAIIFDNQSIPQKKVTKTIHVAHPKIDALASWTDGQKYILPGSAAKIKISLHNIGAEKITNVAINIPLPLGIIDSKKIIADGTGILKDNTLILNSKKFAELASLEPDKTVEITATLPILQSPADGTDLVLSLSPRIQAAIAGINSSTYEMAVPQINLPLGTKTVMTAELRYYTDDGDQLGRGPLPPVLGKETKYWAIINIKNTSSNIGQAEFHAHLTNAAAWTGKTSVSIGKEIQYDEKTKFVTWSAPELSAHETAGIYIELSYTPTKENEKNVVLLDQISFNGTDEFINNKVTATAKSLDTTLPNDALAHTKIISQ